MSRNATFANTDWLQVGFDVLVGSYWYPRDYLVPAYPNDLGELKIREPATYEDFVSVSRVVYSKLQKVKFVDGEWTEAEEV